MPIWHQTHANVQRWIINEQNLWQACKPKNYAKSPIVQDTYFSQYQASSTVLGDGDWYMQVVRQSGGWPYRYSAVEAFLMQNLLWSYLPDLKKKVTIQWSIMTVTWFIIFNINTIKKKLLEYHLLVIGVCISHTLMLEQTITAKWHFTM